MPANAETFFLVGCVRSGTTVLRLLLGHHSQICLCEEADFLVEGLEPGRGFPSGADYREYLDLHRGFRMSGYSAKESFEYPEMLRDFVAQRRRRDGRAVAGFAVHEQLDRLPEIWPGAHYVYLRRDPRDVARSIQSIGWAGNAWHAAKRWLASEEHWQRLRAQVAPEQCQEVRFEELVDDTESVVARILAPLGLQFEAAMLELEKDTSYSRPSQGAAASWRTDATQEEIQLVEALVGDALVRAGYEPSGLPPLRVGALRRVRLALQNRVAGVKFALRRFGPRLWFQGVLSRRLPFPTWRRSVEIRLQDVINQHLR